MEGTGAALSALAGNAGAGGSELLGGGGGGGAGAGKTVTLGFAVASHITL